MLFFSGDLPGLYKVYKVPNGSRSLFGDGSNSQFLYSHGIVVTYFFLDEQIGFTVETVQLFYTNKLGFKPIKLCLIVNKVLSIGLIFVSLRSCGFVERICRLHKSMFGKSLTPEKSLKIQLFHNYGLP